MCLINFAFQFHPRYAFILIGNRDEFYSRPTKELHWWHDYPDIIAGRDLKEGGTWMGMSKDGKIAALTNYRDLRNIKENAPSRGIILTKYLNGELHLDEFHQFLKMQGTSYNGFNVIYGTPAEFYYYTNTGNFWQSISPGIYGLSNALLDTPWEKLIKSKHAFTEMTRTDKLNPEDFIQMMHNTEYGNEDKLPSTGISPKLEKKLSAMFIETENYGSRVTTFISVTNEGQVTYHEKSYIPPHEAEFRFLIERHN